MRQVRPLAGIKVVEIADDWSGCLCGSLLARLGARVTKLTTAGGPGRARWGRTVREADVAAALMSAGKQLVPAEASSGGLLRQAAGADVVLADSGSAAGLSLSGLAGRAVVCRFSPYGSSGPDVSSDLVLQAVSGVMATTGIRDGRPLRAGIELTGAVGACYGAIGTLAALIDRHRGGQGQLVDVSLHAALFSALTNFSSRVLAGQEPLGLIGNQGPNSAPWNLFQAADGQYVYIIAGSDPTFARLCDAMEMPGLRDDPRFANQHSRHDAEDELTAVVAAWTGRLPGAEVVSRLATAGVPVSPVSGLRAVLASEHLCERGVIRLADGGAQILAGLPARICAPEPTDGSAAAGRCVLRRDCAPPADGPLGGLVALDVGTLTAGPFASRLIANLGADVIKVEPPGGEPGRTMPPFISGQSMYFEITNNSKRSAAIDLRQPEGARLMRSIASRSDLLIENFSPGALDRRGLGPAGLLAVNPGLVYCSVSGYGQVGQLAGQRAYDTVIQAGAGMMSVTGEDGGDPLKTGISSADVLGALASCASSLAALFGRVTGRHAGVSVDMALFDVMAWSTQVMWAGIVASGPEPQRLGNGHWCHAPYGVFEAQDGPVALACETDAQWRLLCDAAAGAGVPVPPGLWDLDWSRRWQFRSKLGSFVQQYVGRRRVAELVADCESAGVPAGPLLSVTDAVAEAGRRGMLATVETGTCQPVRIPEFPVLLSRTPGRVRWAAPGLDEHGDEIAAGFGPASAS